MAVGCGIFIGSTLPGSKKKKKEGDEVIGEGGKEKRSNRRMIHFWTDRIRSEPNQDGKKTTNVKKTTELQMQQCDSNIA